MEDIKHHHMEDMKHHPMEDIKHYPMEDIKHHPMQDVVATNASKQQLDGCSVFLILFLNLNVILNV